jgi:hypothetical protein
LVSVRCAELVALWGRFAERIVVGRSDGKRPLGRCRNKRNDRVREEFGYMMEWP